MIKWIPIEAAGQLQQLNERSREIPCLIFKHSTSCSISALSKHRLETYWDIEDGQIELYFLDLLRFRDLSALIAETYGVRHESPQILMIRNGKCTYHRSHLDITAAGIKEQLQTTVGS